MKPAAFLLGALCLLVSGVLATAANPPSTDGIADATLVAAARRATLKDIDYSSTSCDGATTVDTWLKRLAGRTARAITWTGGKCELVNKLNPLDAGGRLCAQATISLVHPRDHRDKPVIEIYLEDPKHGKPGAAYAFRSLMVTREGDGDYLRSRRDFEAEWRERFPGDLKQPDCQD